MSGVLEQQGTQEALLGVRSADRATPAACLRAFFDLLTRHRIAYCVLHGYQDYPDHIRGDVDLLMHPADVPRRLAALLYRNRDLLGADVMDWRIDDRHWVVLAGRDEESGRGWYLQLHISTELRAGGRLLCDAERGLADRVKYNGFFVPSPAVEFSWTLARRIEKESLSLEQAESLKRTFAADPRGAMAEMNRLLGPSTAESLRGQIEAGDWDTVRRRLPELAVAMLNAWHRARERVAERTHKLRRWLRPPGLHVVMLGPDGVGKSTVVDAIMEGLKPAFDGVYYRAFAPMLKRRKPVAPENAPKPHELPVRSRLGSWVKAAWWMVYYGPGYFVTVRRDLARSGLAINHRYFVDALVDQRRYRYSGPVWPLRLIWALVPKPDLIVLLDAAPEIIIARKEELPPDEVRRQVAAYRRLVSRCRNGRIVDATPPAATVIESVRSLIVQHQSMRTRRRLGVKE